MKLRISNVLMGLVICVFIITLGSCEDRTIEITRAPQLSNGSGTYYNKQIVSVAQANNATKTYYTIDGTIPTPSSMLYTQWIEINQNTLLKLRSYEEYKFPSEVVTADYKFAVAPVSASYIGGTYSTPLSVSLSSSTYNAQIRYTTDGQEPSLEATMYIAPIQVSASTIVKAKAFYSSWTSSSTSTFSYILKLPMPSFNPIGGTYTSAQSVSIGCAISGATIRYTLNGDDPSPYSAIYSSPVIVNSTTTLKAKAYKSAWSDSNINISTYTINSSSPVATPTFSPVGGTYNSTQSVSISCATSGSSIRYTTNGSDPNSSSALYTTPIAVSVTTTIKAKAFKAGMPDSSVGSAVYNLTVATPTFSPVGGTYNFTQSVSISCVTSGSSIRYTTNGSDPTSSSALYSSPINVSVTTTLKAKAFKTGWTDSPVGSAVYNLRVATPTFSPVGGTYSSTQYVSISCVTSGSSIRYTTNGSDPTSSSALYSSPFTISVTTTLKAKAFMTGWIESAINSAYYTINSSSQVATPTFSPVGGTYSSTQYVSISCATSGSSIRYTTNGSDPTSSSALYSSPITISVTTTLKAKAFKTGWTDSPVSSSIYTISQFSFEGFESGSFSALPWNNSSANPWSIITGSNVYAGIYSAKSGAILHNGITSIQISKSCSSGNITFYRKVSSELSYDYLIFYIDGVEKARWSGEVYWSSVTYSVSAGTRIFKWTYMKDDTVNSGSDCAWIDNISFP
ncbi:MAG: chitobiase/beta-hexosaminidase C-terminal domain-containing protein [Candidatus Cloacimonadaceae bacterium]|nr:chitobiase/beta-hexosaminidase C-terminal domain-containing protein [Candidatus Cloacimonadaceae bacterium]